jgi:hypothetical protein
MNIIPIKPKIYDLINKPNKLSRSKTRLESIENLKDQLKFINELPNADIILLKKYTLEGPESLTQNMNRRLINIFERVPPLKKDIVVYRGLDIGNIKNLNNIFNQVLSTSLNISIAYFFSNDLIHKIGWVFRKLFGATTCCILEITINAGNKVLPLYSISIHENEEEILLPINTEIIIKDKKYRYSEREVYKCMVI